MGVELSYIARLTQEKTMQALEWVYEKAISDVAGLDSAQHLADDYLRKGGTLEEKINALIRWQSSMSGASGFITGLGGLLTIPASIPANVISVMFIQIRMIAAIATMCGHDVKEESVKTSVLLSLMGDAAVDLVKDFGISAAADVAISAITNIPGKSLTAINRVVGFNLLAKTGQTGLINLGKTVPILGGVISGATDAFTTYTIGNFARDKFLMPERAGQMELLAGDLA
jgi:hypothetical protein